MTLFVLISFSVYLSILYILVRYHIVNGYQVLYFTDITMSDPAYLIVGILWIILGYFFGRKWWKIVYIDKVYRFDWK